MSRDRHRETETMRIICIHPETDTEKQRETVSMIYMSRDRHRETKRNSEYDLHV